VTSFSGLIILSPFLLFISVLIKIRMPGPIFFTQNRIGRNGREFRILKFRTMTLEPKYNESTFEPGNLTRITQLGRFLRRTKIDEIPQLINVLKEKKMFFVFNKIDKIDKIFLDRIEDRCRAVSISCRKKEGIETKVEFMG